MSEPHLKKLEKILVANRGEIAIRVLRAASELRIKTVAIYTYEDRYSLHRYKADESYQIGKDDDPLKPYLNIEEIISLAKRNNVDAIHPGYGFLSENVDFSRRCREEGIIFIGPDPEVMQKLGDKVTAKTIAVKANVPVIPDSHEKLDTYEITLKEAKRIGFPVMIKASAGGGGRGMRVVKEEKALERSYNEARNEAGKSFGDDTVFLEKFVEEPKHIEIQIMADNHGNIVHLFERDCSVQRRFQKVVEIAPSILNETLRSKIYAYALKITKSVDYNNVGTVEFLVDKNDNIYFIEVNPRIQVEHTITEEITGIDIVRSQILIAKGHHLSDPVIFITKQEDVRANGFAIQCRITTEDPGNQFKPDYGTIIAYRNAGGFGIRLDEGSSYPGVKISPFFDSMLVKVSSKGRTLKGASQRLHRALREFRIRGVKTNIRFLENVISHPKFQKGLATVKFIEEHPELFEFKKEADSGTKALTYIADVTINGNPQVKVPKKDVVFRTPVIPEFDKYGNYPKGSKDKLNELGRDGLIQWIKENKSILYTDTTFRDAHQSLLATRVRTLDMMKVAEGFAKNHPQVFSMEVWGGATFDVTMRFLHESPWERLHAIREAIPNILLQMLFRGSNGVGYTAYPNNLIEKFIEKAWEGGIDIFRIFDSLNWVDAMKASIKAVRERTGGIAEAAICYTGEIQDPNNKKYNLQYYVDLAKRLEDEGAHMLCIKDMAGLLKPYAAQELISALKASLNIPIHLHTHDTSSIQSATYLKAIEANVDVIDVALGSMSGLTSQPNFNSLVASMKYHERNQEFNLDSLNQYSNYWEDVREFYYPFESGLKAGTAEVYDHEIPGGQYSNLRPQAESLGLGDRFELVKKNYVLVNQMFGDIVKVTPSSKVVGDMAIFMTSSNLTPEDIYERGETLSFPDSVVGFFKGELGQPHGGFPEKLQKIILKNEKPYTKAPNDYLNAIDFDKEFADFQKKFDNVDFEDFLSFKLYPKVFQEYYQFKQTYGNVDHIPTNAFFYGLKNNEEILVHLGRGKTIIIKLLFVGDADEKGYRIVSFLLNGQNRRLSIKDKNQTVVKSSNEKVSSENHIGAGLQGRIAHILVKEGEEIKENSPLFIVEAMKMESTITASKQGKVKSIKLKTGAMVEQDDLVVEME
ncbi:MAG TPA: pyruvate carboxylase [Cytophagales bacterium]|nr:pyruvate carboxylase [Cytophagales bacterium]